MIIEVLCKSPDFCKKDLIVLITMFLDSRSNLKSNSIIKSDSLNAFDLNKHIEEISIFDDVIIPIDLTKTQFKFYNLDKLGVQAETLLNDDNEEEILASNHWMLPSLDFKGLYESLIFEKGVKENLLKFVQTIMTFSKRGVCTDFVSCNRIVLLHGPPGTGKTSLCKGIAQKLAIHMDEFKFTHLIEINSHSLFSKWFSESGKLVTKLFDKVREIVEHKSSLVCVLIDEVESIAFARSAIGSNEPSDSLRVVNAVLTQLDQLRRYPNVLILTTSNLTSSIDLAFIDRADIKQYIDNPSLPAIYEIYLSAITELIRTEIIAPLEKPFLEYDQIEIDADPFDVNVTFLFIVQKSHGLSGRTLRKIPFLAHAMYVADTSKPILIDVFLHAMDKAIDQHIKDAKELQPASQK